MNPPLTPAPGGTPNPSGTPASAGSTPLMQVPGDDARPELSPAATPGALENEGTGLPGFRSWRGVYLFVFGSFLVWVALLAWLTRFFA